MENIPNAGGSQLEALPEGAIWLLYAGSFPNKKEFADLQADLRKRSHISEDTLDFIKSLPLKMHPLTMVSATLLYLQ